MKMISKKQVMLVRSFDRRDSENAICKAMNRSVTPFYRRRSIKEEATCMIKAAHGEHEFESIKWGSNTAVY